MRKILIILVAIVVSGVILISFLNNKTVDKTSKLEKVRLALAMQPSSGLVMVALEKGFFKKNGVEVEIKEFPSGKRALKDGFFKEKVDIAMSTEVPIVIAMLKGKEFKIAATTFNADNVNRIIARKDSDIKNFSDLKDKRVATQRASAVHFFLHLMLAEHNLLEDDIKLAFMKAEMLPKALASGKIDAFSMREPYISEAKKLLGDNYVIFSKAGLYKQIEAVVVNSEFTKSSPKAINRFIRALIEAEEYIINNRSEAIEIIANRLKVSIDSIEQIWSDVRLRVALEQSTILLMEDIARWAIKWGLTEEKKIPNSLDKIYYEGLKNNKPSAITILHRDNEVVDEN